jgi:hypothetical protein
MTEITIIHEMTELQIQRVLDEHCTIGPEPPDPPDTPDPPDPPDPTDLYNITFGHVWGSPLAVPTGRYDKRFYRLTNVTNRKAAGTSMLIRLPAMSKDYEFWMSDVENTSTVNVARYGVFSWRRDFDKPYIDNHAWGQGGGLRIRLTPMDSNRNLYFNYRIANYSQRVAPWINTLQALIREA